MISFNDCGHCHEQQHTLLRPVNSSYANCVCYMTRVMPFTGICMWTTHISSHPFDCPLVGQCRCSQAWLLRGVRVGPSLGSVAAHRRGHCGALESEGAVMSLFLFRYFFTNFNDLPCLFFVLGDLFL